MIQRNILKVNTDGLNERDAVSVAENYLNDDKKLNGKVLVLYGLRRTGKTTIMEQLIQKNKDNEQCAFYEVEDGDNFDDIKKIIIQEKQKGTTFLCLDEITKADDFLTNASVLPDIFAKEGMKIILTGTDSLGFQFAEENELFDRTIRINTTHIPFAEHCRVLNTNDCDDYIQSGGLMKKGLEREAVYDYNSACKYLDSAVSENIIKSIKKSLNDNCLDELSFTELKTIIEKMVENYSGKFNKKLIQNKLKTASIGYLEKKYPDVLEEDIITKLVLEKKNIINDFLHEINADENIEHVITDKMIRTLERYLIDMNLLSATLQTNYYYTDELGWREGDTEHEYYIVQPAIKYYHLQKAKEFINNEDYYKQLSYAQKEYLKDKLDEKIKGDMTEQIVIFDTAKDLKERYIINKPVFYINGQKKGEYDMLIYDKKENKYWGFEIKHTTQPYYLQEQHLNNKQIKEVIDDKYGHRENVCVLYRGNPFFSDSGVYYLNITDFAIAVNKYSDMDKVMNELTKNLPVKDLSKKQPEAEEKTEKSKEDRFTPVHKKVKNELERI